MAMDEPSRIAPDQSDTDAVRQAIAQNLAMVLRHVHVPVLPETRVDEALIQRFAAVLAEALTGEPVAGVDVEVDDAQLLIAVGHWW